VVRPFLAAVLFAVAGCCAVENRLLYHPTHSVGDRTLPAPIQDVELRTATGLNIHARWCPHPGARGAILYCHGNAGELGHRALAVRELWEALGESVLIFDYPGYGRSEGRPSEAGCYAAAGAAYDWLVQSQGIAPERIVLYGESLGGGVAVDLASRRPHRALVLVKTFTSVADVAEAHCPWLPLRWLVTNRFDNLAKIGRCAGPKIIAQADADRLVPFIHGRRLLDAAGPATFYTLEKSDHNDPLPADFYFALRKFLEPL
jgi:uncharacterized protein